MIFKMARECDAAAVLALYKSVLGEPFCVWNDEYPTEAEIAGDLETGGLYLLCEGGEIVGALSLVPENEMDEQEAWQIKKGAREIARVVVSKQHRGRGLARKMVESIKPVLRESGVPAIHLSVAKSNLPAAASYRAAGFATVGEAHMWGNDYYLMEYIL